MLFARWPQPGLLFGLVQTGTHTETGRLLVCLPPWLLAGGRASVGQRRVRCSVAFLSLLPFLRGCPEGDIKALAEQLVEKTLSGPEVRCKQTALDFQNPNLPNKSSRSTKRRTWQQQQRRLSLRVA